MSSKRFLTEYEIENILSFITPQIGIPTETANIVVTTNKNALRKQLITQQIYPEMIPDLANIIEQQYMSSNIQPGESVGVIGAQSIGEKQTQTTLNTFHKAGSTEKTVTTGVPRIEELLNVTKDPKAISCIIQMKDHHNSISEIRDTIGNDLVELTFALISKSYEIIMDKPDEPWYNVFKILHNDSFTKYTDCISLQIDMDKLYEYKLDLETISTFITDEYTDMVCVYSPDTFGQLDIFIDPSNIELPENRILFINSDNAKQIYLEEVVQPILYKIHICGIPGINNIYFTSTPNTIETDGSNFQKLLGLPFIDSTTIMSDHVWEIYHNLGIEATRQMLIESFMIIMEGINTCHIQLLADKMTHEGIIASISRYTMRNEDSGPMGKASFEETMDNFLKAGVYGQEENTRGVSASIICGKIAHIGSGVCELKINVDALPGQPPVITEVIENKIIKKIPKSPKDTTPTEIPKYTSKVTHKPISKVTHKPITVPLTTTPEKIVNSEDNKSEEESEDSSSEEESEDSSEDSSEEDSSEDDLACEFILTRGVRKGNPCMKLPYTWKDGKQLCKNHSK